MDRSAKWTVAVVKILLNSDGELSFENFSSDDQKVPPRPAKSREKAAVAKRANAPATEIDRSIGGNVFVYGSSSITLENMWVSGGRAVGTRFFELSF